MHEKERDLAAAFVRKEIGRRELLKRSSQLGLGVAATSFLVTRAAGR